MSNETLCQICDKLLFFFKLTKKLILFENAAHLEKGSTFKMRYKSLELSKKITFFKSMLIKLFVIPVKNPYVNVMVSKHHLILQKMSMKWWKNRFNFNIRIFKKKKPINWKMGKVFFLIIRQFFLENLVCVKIKYYSLKKKL